MAVPHQRAVRLDAGLAQRTLITLEPPPGSDGLGVQVDEPDSAVARLGQPPGRDVAASHLVRNDRRQATLLVEAVHQNGGYAGQAGRRVERAMLAGRADESLDTVLEHRLHRLLVESRIAVDGRDQQGLPLQAGAVLCAADDPGTEWRGDNVGDQPDQACALRRERARAGVGAVPQRGDRGQNPCAGFVRDVRRGTVAQHERDRRTRDARMAGDVRHRHAPLLRGHRQPPSGYSR